MASSTNRKFTKQEIDCFTPPTNRKFTKQEVDRFNDKISNVMDNDDARSYLEEYLKKSKLPVQKQVFDLWKKAHNAKFFDEEDFLDAIDDIDGFSTKGLIKSEDESGSSSDEQNEPDDDRKLMFVKQECCRILDKIRPRFIEYLTKNKM